MRAGQEMKNGKVYGCHVDLTNDDEPDGCVVDTGDHGDCIYGFTPSGRERRSKWTCKHWKPVTAKEQS